MEASTSIGKPDGTRSCGAGMSDDRLTEKLAAQILGWKAAPGRFIKPGGGWTPRWKFAPLRRIEDAFELLDIAASTYTLTANKNGGFTTEVRVDGRMGQASGKSKARTITLALAQAIGLEVPQE